MCGIVGVIALDAPRERLARLVTQMADRLAHRGPDGGGTTTHHDATLAMRRLAIVDVEHGQQPMENDDGSLVIVFNGEIYNAPQLRAAMQQRGIRFRTRSDTEVILRLYEEGASTVEAQLVGMWAFAIHDRRQRRVVLSRDRLGVKPLYVADTGTAIAFASELRAFDRDLPGFARLFEPDVSSAHAMLSWSYIPETATIYKGVRRLPPASRLEIDLASGHRTPRTYWTLSPSREAASVASLDDASRAVESLLRRSVREHLESDVPVATLLSGGIDSSLITALAHEESGRAVKAYTIGFRESRFDESPFARETAAKIGIELSVAMFDETTARQHLADALMAYDEPFGDSSSLATFLLCKHVGSAFKVALGGDGGDEVFAGYAKYSILHARRILRSSPGLRNALGSVLGKVPSRTDRTRGWTEALRLVRRLARGLEGEDSAVYAALTQFASLDRTAELVRAPGASHFLDRARERFEAVRGTELQQYLASDLAGPLPNDMLVKVDRASMANHLEVRVPFLDHRIVEFGIGLPRKYLLSRQGKRVLRALHASRFGDALAHRRKQGFGVPVESWLRGSFRHACERLFERNRLDRFGILSTHALSDGAYRRWLGTDPMILWNAFVLAGWCEATLGDGPEALKELLA